MVNYFPEVWLDVVRETLAKGSEVSPRGKLTKEVMGRTVAVDMSKPVLNIKERSLSYTFMLAEAYWILSGDNRVSTIEPYNKRISGFSDDGETFFGAYGPEIQAQMRYVVNKLTADRDSRQAGLTIWKQNPPETKDVPCTVAIFFNIRNGYLHCNTFMRSSDIWLGLPYDVFNFSILTHLVCATYNHGKDVDRMIRPGTLYLTAASSHLYEENFKSAKECLLVNSVGDQSSVPDSWWQNGVTLMGDLGELKDLPPTSSRRWWLN